LIVTHIQSPAFASLAPLSSVGLLPTLINATAPSTGTACHSARAISLKKANRSSDSTKDSAHLVRGDIPTGESPQRIPAKGTAKDIAKHAVASLLVFGPSVWDRWSLSAMVRPFFKISQVVRNLLYLGFFHRL
jgi:hypothetical protein